MIKKIAILLILSFFCCTGIFAQVFPRPLNHVKTPGEDLTIKIAVVGPGDQLYFWWGHIALIIEDARTKRNYFFDYGIFDFDADDFFYNFAFGRLLYSCGVSPAELNMEIYEITNRNVVYYTLDIPPEAREKVRDFAEFNIQPENADYFYHHFKDNCSTRIRDIIDLAVNGQLYEQFGNKQSRFTLREHVRRHTWFSPAADWFLNFLMGQVIDTPITVWDDMFLPSEVGKWIEDFYYTDAAGNTVKLVSHIETILTAENRPIVLELPRKQWLYQLIFSLILTSIFFLFFYLQLKNHKIGRVLAGLNMSFCSLFFGVSGLLLYFMSLFTNHDYTFQNANMIFCTPLLLAGVPFGINYAFTEDNAKFIKYNALLRLLWLITVLGLFISMVIKFLPWFYQDNLADQMLIFPIALLFVFHPVGFKEAVLYIKCFGEKYGRKR
ncbi:MAG: DUF4105 domain-containing protein [Treponema sp.]|nr:DUF4105 domain-containing protein [Treponema sp.]